MPRAAAAGPARHFKEPSAEAQKASVQSRRYQRKTMSVAKRLLVLAAVLLAVLGAAYAAGTIYFKDHFTPGTIVNGFDASNLTTDELAGLIEGQVDSWQMSVAGEGLDLTVTAADVSLAVNADAIASEAREQTNVWTWPIDSFGRRTITIDEDITYDAEALASVVTSAVEAYNETAEDPTDATITYDKDTGLYKVTSSNVGTKLQLDVVLAAVEGTPGSLTTDVTIGDDALVQPTLNGDNEDLNALVTAANKELSNTLTFTFAGTEVATADADIVRNWVSIKDGAVVTDEAAIGEWVEEKLSSEVASEDDYGYYGLDADATTAAAIEALKADGGEVEVQTMTLEYKPAPTEGASELGRHIDVNLSTQYARFYNADGKVIWESYIVSGNTSTDHGTITGTFSIYAKQRGQTLIGADEDEDGEPDYESYVEYWMPFSGGYGLHDASWRSSFGGTIYQYSGSHGCVNLPTSKAAELYSIVKVGDTVIVHW